jgi:hypothetical protein
MKRRVAHLLALVTASSTMLVGMPLLAASLSCVAWPTCSISAASPEYDPAGESRGESIEEEREEDVESKVAFLAQRPANASLDMLCVGKAEQRGSLGKAGPQAFLRSIRGPPSA